MRKLKKFKRFEKGGLTDSSGNPVLSGDGTPIQTMEDTETPDEKYAKRREGYESIKDFFMGRRSKDEPSAPIEERKPPKKAAEEDKAPIRAAVKPAEPAKTEKIEPPRVQSTAVNRGETSYDYPTQRDSKRDDYEGDASPTSGGRTFKRAAPKPVAPKPKPPAPASAPAPAAPAKAPIAASPNQIPGTDVKTPYEGEKIDNRGLAAKQLAQSTLGATAAGRTLGAGARGAIGLGRMFESLSKPAPKEAPRTEPKLDSKSAPKQGELFDAKGNPTAEATGAKPAPKEAPKSGAIQPTGKGPSEAGKKLMEKGKGSLKDQAMEAVNKQRVTTKDSRGTVRPEPRTIKPTGKGPSEAGKKLMGRTNTRSSTILEKERKPDLAMQEYISGRETARNRVKDLSDDGLSAERYANKKGGKIPAFKKGGLVGRADGCAIRGKTKGRMV